MEETCWVPEHVRAYLRELGYALPLEAMEGHIREWDGWMAARGDFYRYRDTDCVESIALEQKSHQFLSRYRKSAGQLIEHPRPASARG